MNQMLLNPWGALPSSLFLKVFNLANHKEKQYWSAVQTEAINHPKPHSKAKAWKLAYYKCYFA